MMTKDEAKELTKEQLNDKISVIMGEYDYLNVFGYDDIIQQNWLQITKQLCIWFSDFDGNWDEHPEVIVDPIGWMLRAYVASKDNG